MKLDVHVPYAAFAASALMLIAVPLIAKPATPAAAKAPAGNAAMGGKLFLQCRACHTVGAGEPGGVGPNLSGVVGAKAGARPGFAYSPAMAGSGLVWNAATLDRFLARPSAVVPGTRMAFAGVAAPKSRADLIAYLTTLETTRR